MRGLSLLETMLSLSLLTAGALVLTLNLFHPALRAQAQARRAYVAAQWAESLMAELRAQAAEPSFFRGDWSAYAGLRTHPDFPDLKATVEHNRTLLDSPCSALEERFPSDPRRFQESLVCVKISARWGEQRQPVVVVSQIAAPPVEPAELRLTRVAGDSDPVPPDGAVTFEAQLLDAEGNQIPGVMFDWYVLPLSGNATLAEDGPRAGRRATLNHRYYFDPVRGDWDHVPGVVRLKARTRYHGRIYQQESSDLVLGS